MFSQGAFFNSFPWTAFVHGWNKATNKTRVQNLRGSSTEKHIETQLPTVAKIKQRSKRRVKLLKQRKVIRGHACKIAEFNKCIFHGLTSGCGVFTKYHIVYGTELVQGVLAHFFFSFLVTGAHECAKALDVAFATFAFKSCPWVFSEDLNCHVRNAVSQIKRSNISLQVNIIGALHTAEHYTALWK